MLKKILIGVAILILAAVVVVGLQPAEFQVSRSVMIAAPPEAVFAQANDLHKWEAWSPWAKLDPAAKNSYEGPGSGVGAAFAWSGNKEVGEGRMTITESRPSELVRFRLDFLKPFKSTCTTEFMVKPQGNQTLVTWTMAGKNNFIAKAVHLCVDCDKMVGGDFEKGLAQLKSRTEVVSTK